MKHLLIFLTFFGLIQFLGAQEIDRRIRLDVPQNPRIIKMPANFDSLSRIRLKYQLPLPELHTSHGNLFIPEDSINRKLAEEQRMKKLFGTYDEFKIKFLALELKNEMPDLGSYNAYADLFQIKNPVSGGGFGYSFDGPISYFYNKKEEASRRRVNALKNSEPLRRKVNAKYNREKIQQWTGLKDEKLTRFVLYCHFDEDYLVRVNEYELIDTVLKKFIEFKAKEDSANFRN